LGQNVSVAKQIKIKDGSDSILMPDWFKDLVTLGTSLGSWEKSQGRLVLALACPTSRFAAGAISLGIIWAESKKLRSIKREEMLLRLSSINIGEYISIRANMKQVIGRFLGIENSNEVRVGGSRYMLSKIEELHPVKSHESPRDASNLISETTARKFSTFIDPNNTLSTLAQTFITLVGDKEKVEADLELEIGVSELTSSTTDFQTLSSIVKVKNDLRHFGWCSELLSVDELLLQNSNELPTHLILANNRACVELSEYQIFNTKVFLLDSRSSLSMAHQSIQRYTRYCEKIDLKSFGWKPHKAFRGIVMVDKNEK
jgi:hypothetical protein